MREEIARLHSRLGLTMLYVTHDQMEAMTLGGRIAVMNLGKLQQVATPMELYQIPSQPVCRGVFRLAVHELF
jgi:ABC-type sugar transport system ATPase subunit